MVVSNKTFVDSEMSFNVILKSTRKTIINKLFYAIAILIIGGLIFGLSFTSSDQAIFYQIISYVMMGGAFAVGIWIVIQYNMAPEKVKKANESTYQNGLNYSYLFREQYFKVECKGNGKTTKLEYPYKNVKKCLEFENTYEFRLKDSQIVVISKDGFENARMIEYFLSNLNKNKIKMVDKRVKEKE